jgi:hypothetical protein
MLMVTYRASSLYIGAGAVAEQALPKLEIRPFSSAVPVGFGRASNASHK